MSSSSSPPSPPLTLWSNITASVATVVEGRRLDEWVDLLHANNCYQRGWDVVQLHRGSFGFEILAVSVLALARAPCDSTIDELAAIVHTAWSIAYIHWRDNPPPSPYRRPYNPLGDLQRDTCAAQGFDELPTDEQEKDRVVVRGFLANRDAAH